MTTQPQPYLVSGTFLEWLNVCPTGASYYKLAKRTPVVSSGALVFGSHIHTAQAFRARQFEHGRHNDEQLVFNLLQSEFAREPVPEGDWRTLDWAFRLHQEHAKRYPIDIYPLLRYPQPKPCPQCCTAGAGTAPDIQTDCVWCNNTRLHSVMVEASFVCKLYTRPTGQDVFLHGYMDLPCLPDGRLFNFDYKTTSMLGSGYFDAMRVSTAQKGYSWALGQLMSQPVQGFIIRALRTKEPPANVTAGKPGTKTIDRWFDESFQEERFFFGEDELADWHNNTVLQLEQFFAMQAAQQFPRCTSQCSRKFGRCDYWDVCNTYPANQRHIVLSSGLYRDREEMNEKLQHTLQ